MKTKETFQMLRQLEETSLYSFDNEHDSCGVGLIVTLQGDKEHEIVEKGLQVLENMVHRGAESADNLTGDGAGITVQVPHEFILLQGIPVPQEGKYGTGLVFLPRDEKKKEFCLSVIAQKADEEGLSLFHIRDVPVNSGCLGEIALKNEPVIKQLFLTGPYVPDEMERKLYVLRKKVERAIQTSVMAQERSFYMVSLSTRQLVYKGMLSSLQLRRYFPDLSHPNFTSRFALIHSRFSTNTFPTWDLAQPFRMLAHNGEINTIRGNRQWMQSRESLLQSDRFHDMKALYPIVQPGMSDSASIDNVLEFLVMSGKSLPHALAILVPESFNAKNPIPDGVKAFYEYHSMLMEPWDGPATLLFSDGRYAGGMLDRNGLRPARYTLTRDGVLILASETGTLPLEGQEIKERGRLKPGKMLLVDTLTGTIYSDSELKESLAKAYPYREWLNRNCLELEKVFSGRNVNNEIANREILLKTFGYSVEDLEFLIQPMALHGKEPVSSMGNDATLAVLSDKPQRLFNYFRQQFAQVTNPPIDPIREELVMSLTGYLGAVHQNLLDEIPALSGIVKVRSPILTNTHFDILLNLRYKGF